LFKALSGFISIPPSPDRSLATVVAALPIKRTNAGSGQTEHQRSASAGEISIIDPIK
jgi:hypothetical protein